MGYIPASTKGEAFRYVTKQTLSHLAACRLGGEVSCSSTQILLGAAAALSLLRTTNAFSTFYWVLYLLLLWVLHLFSSSSLERLEELG